MIQLVEHIAGVTYHGRKDSLDNQFRYGIDYLLLDPDHAKGPSLFSRNRPNFAALYDKDHGGPQHAGGGVLWAHEVLKAHAQPKATHILLLTQPRILGHVFNLSVFSYVTTRPKI